MSDDVLQRAARALRDSSQGDDSSAGATRLRVLASARRKYAPRRTLALRWALVCAGMLASGTAMAARHLGGWPELWHAIAPAAWTDQGPRRGSGGTHRAGKPQRAARSVPGQAGAPDSPAGRSADPPRSTKASAARSAPTPALASLSAAPADVPAGSGPLPAKPKSHGPTAARSNTLRAAARPIGRAARGATAPNTLPTTREEPAALAPARDDATAPSAIDATAEASHIELALFRTAERLHRAHDPGALQAWEAYLRAAPRGILAPEARYNRALCLVRQRMLDAARSALEPFANGQEGGYRQKEARALLMSISR